MASTTVYITIRNNDDRLTQTEWCHFAAYVDQALRRFCPRIHGAWTSESIAPWQNACWHVDVSRSNMDLLKKRLSVIAKKFRQEGIEWTPAPRTNLIRAAE